MRNDTPDTNREELSCFWNILLDNGYQGVERWFQEVGKECPHLLLHVDGKKYFCSPPPFGHYVRIVCSSHEMLLA